MRKMRHIFKMMLGLSSICFLTSSLVNCLNSHDISNKIQNKNIFKICNEQTKELLLLNLLIMIVSF